jgi:hypothetical protein
MRHEDYHNSPLPSFYVQMARWCNQPAFFKKMSFWEFCYRNQSYHEEKNQNNPNIEKFQTLDKVLDKVNNGYYNTVRLCSSLKAVLDLLKMFPEHQTELTEMINYKMIDLQDPSLWEK